jgi:hypothetical protein
MEAPQQYPHVSVYYPQNAEFEMLYDIVIAIYHKPGHRVLYGYHLKESNKIPKDPVSEMFSLSVLVRGQPAESGAKELWTIPSEKQIESFFGESGRHWTPTAWRTLLEKKKNRIDN